MSGASMRRILRAGLTAICLVLASCVQYPTESRSVVDQRPQIMFRLAEGVRPAPMARVIVDGLDAGPLSRFVDSGSALRVTPGTHTIRVSEDARVLLEERVYLGDGVSRSFLLQ
jgi:hypothetical protein